MLIIFPSMDKNSLRAKNSLPLAARAQRRCARPCRASSATLRSAAQIYHSRRGEEAPSYGNLAGARFAGPAPVGTVGVRAPTNSCFTHHDPRRRHKEGAPQA